MKQWDKGDPEDYITTWIYYSAGDAWDVSFHFICISALVTADNFCLLWVSVCINMGICMYFCMTLVGIFPHGCNFSYI